MSKKLITTISMALALATGGVAIPVAGADTGPPQQGGRLQHGVRPAEQPEFQWARQHDGRQCERRRRRKHG
jgi:hypothetical protein